MKKTLALLLALVMVLGMLAGCNNNPDPTEAPTTTNGDNGDDGQIKVEEFVGEFTYKDSVSKLAANWNPHTYETSDDSYPAEFIRVGLYGFIFNDALHPVEGKDDFAGYKIIPEMAASEPVDVTEKVAKEHPEFNIPEGMTKGYAYTIDLNQNACWEDGTPIKAEDYVYSMKALLDPTMYNYRAADYIIGDFSIAGGLAYNYQGTTAYTDVGGIPMDGLTKRESDGVYVDADGNPIGIAVKVALSDWLGGDTLADYVETYGSKYFNTEHWDELVDACDRRGVAPLTDENLALLVSVISTDAWGESEADAFNYFVRGKYYEEVDFSTVGCYATGEYQITIVLAKSLAGFNLLYNLTSNWLVHKDLYEANITTDPETGYKTSKYNTSVATTLSYGPYKLDSYQADKEITFVKNENWYGYSDELHVYQDPESGLYYRQYQTTKIYCQYIKEAETRKTMFLAGQLMGYGLGTDDFGIYRQSDRCYATPGQAIFFLVLNGKLSALSQREEAEDFDTTKYDLQTMSLASFKKAMSLVYEKDLFAQTVSPSRSGAIGAIGTAYIYDPETGAKYRDSDPAKKALCTFYGVDISKYDTLDDAVASITGYDPEQAKVYFNKAFEEALEQGYITSADGKTSDQTIQISYTLSAAASDFMTKMLDYLNEKVTEVTQGTAFEGKVEFIFSPIYDDWSGALKAGLSDTCLCGWNGSAMNPFSLTDLYVNPDKMYNTWFDANAKDITMDINGESITMSMKQWSDCLNGTAIEVNGKNYNFGDGQVDVEIRLNILAALEVAILETGDYIPIMQDGSMALLSHQVDYVIEDYNPVMGRGGIAYLRYNYNEDEWTQFIKDNGGELKY